MSTLRYAFLASLLCALASPALAQPKAGTPAAKARAKEKEAKKADPPPEPPPPPPPPPKPERQRWVVHGVELSVTKKAAFRGTVVLRLNGAEKTQLLSYHWGGQCKDSTMDRATFDLLLAAMREQYTVEIPGYPLRHNERIYMCMQGVRVLREN